MQQNFESAYTTKEVPKSEISKTKSKAPLKKKNFKRRDTQKVSLNVRQNSTLKKKRRSSKSRKRSASRKKAKAQDVDKHSFINRSSLGHKSSFSPGKDFGSTDKKVKGSF